MPHSIQQEVGVGLALELCDRGRYREAEEALGPYVEEPEYLLAAGTVASWRGLQDQRKGAQEEAKDFFSRSARLYGDSDLRAEPLAMLAMCYWRCGESAEALIAVNEALQVNPQSFRAILVKAIILTDQEHLGAAQSTLKVVVPETLTIGQRGRFYHQRALVFEKQAQRESRAKAKLTRDRAILDYTATAVCMEEIGHLSGVATARNNLAAVLSDCGRIDDAHKEVDAAIALWLDLDDRGQLAQAFDQKARIYLKEHKAPDALKFANKAVQLLSKGEQKAWLAEIEITQKRAEIMQRNEQEERDLIKKALKATDGATTKAAVLLGLTQPGLAFKLNNHYPELLPLRKEPRARRKTKRR